MSIVISTNVASLNAQRNLTGTQWALSRNLAHLSSGMRISSAADDAAGLAISEDLKASIRSTAQAERNANDGVSLTQVAEGALEQIGDILTRMRELAVQSSNGTVDSTSRSYINNEFIALRDELDRISDVTEFNGTLLLQGSMAAGLSLQVGIANTANDRIAITLSDAGSASLGNGASHLSAESLDTQTNAQGSIAVIDAAIAQVSAARAGLGALQNRLQVTITNLSTANENLSAANSRIRDVDVASETALLTKNQILSQAGIAVLAQANSLPSAALSLLR
jgi:flagellin